MDILFIAVLRRQIEVYAGFMHYTDHHVGRLLDSLNRINILDDTLVYYVIGDKGASAEGMLNGMFNEILNFNGMAALETEIPHRPDRQVWRPGIL
jgi:arylsulfatase